MPESFQDAGIRQIKLVDFEMSREIGIVFSARGQAIATEGSMFIDTIRRINNENNAHVWRLNER